MQLHEHTVYWAVDQIEKLQDLIDRITYDDKITEPNKQLLFEGLAQQLNELCELLYPLNHDEVSAVEWAQSFVVKYLPVDPDDLNHH